MIADNAEVTVKFKAIESAPPIVLVIRSSMQTVVGKGQRDVLDVDEDINGAKRTYEVSPEQDFKHLSHYMQIGVNAYQEIGIRCREAL